MKIKTFIFAISLLMTVSAAAGMVSFMEESEATEPELPVDVVWFWNVQIFSTATNAEDVRWEFGDGSPALDSRDQGTPEYDATLAANGGDVWNPVHQYPHVKGVDYVLTQTVYNSFEGGSSDSMSSIVRVMGPPTVTFVGDGISIDPVSVPYDDNLVSQTVTQPEDPVREGYTFRGWFTDEDRKIEYDFSSKVRKDLTLYAKWTAENEYIITFSTGGGSAVDDVTDEYNTNVTLPGLDSTTKTGHTFRGWSLTDGGDLITSHVLVDDVTLYAVWEINEYIVTLTAPTGMTGFWYKIDDAPGWTVYSAPFTVSHGQKLEMEALIDTGYSFVMWADSITDNPLTVVSVTGDIFYTPTVAINIYTVTFNGNDGIGSEDDIEKNFGETVTVPAYEFTKTGHTQTGWNTAADGTGTPYSAGATFPMPAEDMTLYAIWTINQYTISFNANGGTGTAAPIIQNYGTEVTLPGVGDLAKARHSFGGWSETVGGTALTSYTVPAADATLYAVWEIITYTVTVISAEGPETYTIEEGGALSDVYEFTTGGTTAFYLDEDHTEAYDADEIVTEDITVYALYTETVTPPGPSFTDEVVEWVEDNTVSIGVTAAGIVALIASLITRRPGAILIMVALFALAAVGFSGVLGL